MRIITAVVILIVSSITNSSDANSTCIEILLNNNATNIFQVNSTNGFLSKCTLFIFQASDDEVVEINFIEFNVGHYKASCEDDLVYVNLHASAKMTNVTWTGKMCGTLQDISNTLISLNSLIIMKFEISDLNSTEVSGKYRFIKKDNFKMTGRRMDETNCEYEFKSEEIKKSGRFYSPHDYLSFQLCRYWFRAKNNEIINITFHQINLGNSDISCLDSKDVIKIYEGKILDRRKLTRILCNTAKYVQYLSSGSDIMIELSTNSRWPPMFFTATYSFIRLTTAEARYQIPANHQKDTNFIHPFGSVLEELQCNRSISSSIGEGNISLDKTRSTRCTYNFEARGSSRVKISYTKNSPSVNYQSNFNVSCANRSKLTALVWSEKKLNHLSSFCNNIPHNIMSNGPRLVLMLDIYNNATTWDYTPRYQFTQRFGIENGTKLDGFECGFLYRAEDWPTGGYFTSPNYPGLYPRQIECHYFFQGLDWQKVKITFQYFDVQGSPPCNYSSQSDYLEFSNCSSRDIYFPRKCGRSSFTVISQKKYFRVTFKSNDMQDGTGFKAKFRFFNDQQFLMTSINQSLNITVSHNMIWCMARTFLKLILLFFLLN